MDKERLLFGHAKTRQQKIEEEQRQERESERHEREITRIEMNSVQEGFKLICQQRFLNEIREIMTYGKEPVA